MGGMEGDGYHARTQDEVETILEGALDTSFGDDVEPYAGAYNRALITGFAIAISQNQEQDIEELYNSIFVTLADGEELTDLAKQYDVIRKNAISATGYVEWTRSSTSSEQVISKGTPVSTEEPEEVLYETSEALTILGAETLTDSSTYSTQNTSFVTKSTYTVDASFRDSIDVEAEYRTTNSSYTAYIEIVDATNSTNIDSANTTSTTFQTVGPTTYDISNIEGDITIEYRIRIGNSSGTAEMKNAYVDKPGQSGGVQNIIADEAGTEGNVGAARVTKMPSPPPNISSVTNPKPVGDPDFTLTDDSTPQTIGQDREDDDSLRDRVLDGGSIGGSATVRAIRDKIRALDGNPSLTIYTNREETDNANGNGLPKLSTELIIYAPSVSDEDIGTAIFEIVGVTARLTSGHNGTAKSYTISETTLQQDWVIEWSEPVQTNLEITLDVVDEDGYAGDESVRDVIASYIGGTLTDGSVVSGTDVDEDVIVDEIERRVNSLEGVIGVASVTLDSDGDGTDDTTTRSDGLTAYETSSNEIALVDATQDITIS